MKKRPQKREIVPMNNSFDNLRNLVIGTVEYVSPREIKILLDIDAPQNTALNTGIPTLFPKVNGFVLIPNEAGSLIGIISWIGVEHSPYPKRKGYKDFDLIDLPFPLRKLSISPIGILKENSGQYEIERGVYSYPSVGDSVVIPNQEQLRSIVQNKDENAKVKIGVSPLAANASVYVNPDRVFGRHIAILGNTGSGKSCTVAGLIRWSMEAAHKNIVEGKKCNARFIILDPNGEYCNSFDDICSIRKYKVNLGDETDEANQLRVPVWMWNSFEWGCIAQASGKTQKPLLRQALRAMRNDLSTEDTTLKHEIKRYLATLLTSIKSEKNAGNPWGSFPRPKNFTEKLRKWNVSISSYIEKIGGSQEITNLIELNTIIQTSLNSRSGLYPTYEFTSDEVNVIQTKLEEAFEEFGGKQNDLLPKSEDAPIPFDSEELLNFFSILADDYDATQYVDYFLMRIRTILADSRMSLIIGTKKENEITLREWLELYIGTGNSENGEITIIDLSLVPPDILFIVVSVISRLIFEALQRYRRQSGEILPTTLVIEEAHNFIKRFDSESDEISASQLCSHSFEKIAKEGRKFGLGLVLSSQRPSELSQTVLSQCNTYLLHRLVNDRDQEMVKKLVPDNLGSILNELPILPTKKAILLGWAAPIPILVEINELPEIHQPKSKDPSFWDVWTGKEDRLINWELIADIWQKST